MIHPKPRQRWEQMPPTLSAREKSMRRYILAGPLVEPLTLAEAKNWLKVDHAEDDALITALVKGARERIEARTGRAIMAQAWRITLDRWPAGGRLTLPVLPMIAVTAIRLFDAAGAPSLLASSLYALEAGAEPPQLAAEAAPNPGRARNGIEIDVVAGYGAEPSDCPEPLRQAIRLLVLAAYEARGPERAGAGRPDVIAEVDRLIAPYRLIKLNRAALEVAA
jgi:uncharacterized phiE125 gp8 family phage protein